MSDSLSERRREILALYLAGQKRAEIAERVGLSARAVEREIFKIMNEARARLAERSGGGCMEGEPLVPRLAYGLASSAEAGAGAPSPEELSPLRGAQRALGRMAGEGGGHAAGARDRSGEPGHLRASRPKGR